MTRAVFFGYMSCIRHNKDIMYLWDINNERQVLKFRRFIIGIGDKHSHRLNNLKNTDIELQMKTALMNWLVDSIELIMFPRNKRLPCFDHLLCSP